MTPENPFAGSDVPPQPEALPQVPENVIYTGLAERFPVWTLLDVLWVTLIAIVAIFFCTVAALLVATGLPVFRHASVVQLATDPRVIVPGQVAAYGVLVFFVQRMITKRYGTDFAEGIRWRWPELRWSWFVAGGAILAIAIQLLSRFVPIPKQMPIDEMFRSPASAWIMAIFGVAIAPFVEELFFRGLLFPALTRRIGLIAGLLITSCLFAVIHASQLGKAWGPVLILFVVGFVLTFVRWRAESLASSCLVHVGYNLTLFGMLFVSSDGFRHLEKLGRP